MKANKLAKYCNLLQTLISVVVTLSKLFARIYLRKLFSVVGEKYITAYHQFRFRGKHLTMEQCHPLGKTIESKCCFRLLFLNVGKACDNI